MKAVEAAPRTAVFIIINQRKLMDSGRPSEASIRWPVTPRASSETGKAGTPADVAHLHGRPQGHVAAQPATAPGHQGDARCRGRLSRLFIGD